MKHEKLLHRQGFLVETHHLTVPEALLSPDIAKILGTVKLRAGALTRRACCALSLTKVVRPRRDAAGLKLSSEFMKVTQNWCGLPGFAARYAVQLGGSPGLSFSWIGLRPHYRPRSQPSDLGGLAIFGTSLGHLGGSSNSGCIQSYAVWLGTVLQTHVLISFLENVE